MNLRSTLIFIAALALLGSAITYSAFRGAIPAVSEPESGADELVSSGDSPFSIPEGFELEVFASGISGARVMVRDPFGNIIVSQPSRGKISILEVKDGKFVKASTLLEKLDNPHGLAVDPEHGYMLYFAEEGRISRVPLYSDGSVEKIADLPRGGGHSTRSLGFGPDGRLYVSIGSSCNVCNEEDGRRAKIFSMNPDGSGFAEFAKGLRNTVFFAWDPMSGKMWGADMGRDFLGDDLPPDEINLLEEGKNYGWPVCYGDNVHDTDFDKNTYFRNPCMEPMETGSMVDLPAHSAPLGMAFAPKNSWPAEYAGDMFLAYHGSWNRSEPTGYKIVRVDMGGDGASPSAPVDFIAGWLKDGEVLGRPVDVKFFDGAMYVSDDKAGAIYRVYPQ